MPAPKVKEYLDLATQIDDLKKKQSALKEEIAAELGVLSDPKPGQKWTYNGLGKVEVCKGRTTTRLDRKKLVLAGVTAEVLDKATVSSTAAPSLRISRD